MGAFRSRSNEAHPFDVLPPNPGSTKGKRAAASLPDVVDAEFEVIRNEPMRRPYKVHNDNQQGFEPNYSDIGFRDSNRMKAAGLSALENALQRFSRTTFAALAVLIFMTVFWAVGSMTLASHLPHAKLLAAPQDPLVIGPAHVSMRKSNGVPFLEVSARIRNQSSTTRDLPTITLELVPGINSKSPLTVSPLVSTLRAGESTSFTARYPYSGGKLPQARLAFETRDAPAL